MCQAEIFMDLIFTRVSSQLNGWMQSQFEPFHLFFLRWGKVTRVRSRSCPDTERFPWPALLLRLTVLTNNAEVVFSSRKNLDSSIVVYFVVI